MRIKHAPDDFVVEELSRVEPGRSGPVSLYELRKRKIDTFEALRRISARADVPLDKIAYVGLKDRQAITTQMISVDRAQIPNGLRIPDIQVRYLGRLDRKLQADDLLGNRFRIVVRDLSAQDVAAFEGRLERVLAHGLVNYFDDQRFGSAAAGQGFPGRDLARGEHEEAVKKLIGTPGKRDPLSEKKFKKLVQRAWGDWELIATKWGNRKHNAIVTHLKRRPEDFAGCLERMPAKERAIHVFAYQSWIWNEAVARYLQRRLPSGQRSRTPYVAGEHVWFELPADQPSPDLVETFPLLDPTVRPEDPDVLAAIEEVLARENLTLETFQIQGVRGCFFKHYERELVVRPRNLTLTQRAAPDEKHPGRQKVGLTFELPPGAYATLVLRRLFGGLPSDEEERQLRKAKQHGDDDEAPSRDRDASPTAASRGGKLGATKGGKGKTKFSKTKFGKREFGKGPPGGAKPKGEGDLNEGAASEGPPSDERQPDGASEAAAPSTPGEAASSKRKAHRGHATGAGKGRPRKAGRSGRASKAEPPRARGAAREDDRPRGDRAREDRPRSDRRDDRDDRPRSDRRRDDRPRFEERAREPRDSDEPKPKAWGKKEPGKRNYGKKKGLHSRPAKGKARERGRGGDTGRKGGGQAGAR